jgi:hypothetical protein
MPPEIAAEWEFGTPGFIEKMSWLISKQAVMLQRLSSDGMKDRLSIGFPLLVGIASNAIAILRLARQNFGNEVYPLLRTLIERTLTFYYLQCCDEVELENYVDYSKQKALRKLHREIRINEKVFRLKYSGSIDLTQYPDLEKALAKFTSQKSKREITRWSPKTLNEKLQIVDHAGIVDVTLLMILLETTYDDASEVLHGTLYGCLFFLGAFTPGPPPRDAEEIRKHYRSDLSAIFFLVHFLLIDLNEYLGNELKNDELMEQVKSGRSQCLDLYKRSGVSEDNHLPEK